MRKFLQKICSILFSLFSELAFHEKKLEKWSLSLVRRCGQELGGTDPLNCAQEVVSLGEEAHLNTSFKHFVYFIQAWLGLARYPTNSRYALNP
jgi:hypothetical protein